MMYEHESNESCQCGVCSVANFERNNYFHGKMLSARDLRQEQEYFNEKRRLINRTVLGWGIVCGLEVDLEGSCLTVKPGLALDCCGRELRVCEREALHPNKIAEVLGIEHGGHYEPVRWALCLEYGECKSEPVKLPTSCNQAERGREYNRIRDDYRLSIRPFEDACPVDHSDDCCPFDDLQHTVSIHKELVEKSHHCPKCKKCECVLLATGTLRTQPGQGFQIRLDEDYWKYRRVVYTNSTLASLVRCFHPRLAHVTDVNWRWKPGSHYSVSGFLSLLTEEYLKVTFDRPLQENTVTNPHTLRLSVFISKEGACPTQLLIPVHRIEYKDYQAVYYFDSDCIEHELRASCKKLKKPAEVELVLHGSMILNDEGRALDGEMIRGFPTGNGVEGGDFITYFTVGP